MYKKIMPICVLLISLLTIIMSQAQEINNTINQERKVTEIRVYIDGGGITKDPLLLKIYPNSVIRYKNGKLKLTLNNREDLFTQLPIEFLTGSGGSAININDNVFYQIVILFDDGSVNQWAISFDDNSTEINIYMSKIYKILGETN